MNLVLVIYFIITIFLSLSFLIYFLPTFIAIGRKKRKTFRIFLLNLFLGWFFIGWIVALVWAMSYDPKDEK